MKRLSRTCLFILVSCGHRCHFSELTGFRKDRRKNVETFYSVKLFEITELFNDCLSLSMFGRKCGSGYPFGVAHMDIQKSSVPQVILMKSKKRKEDDSTGKAACLARNVYTKNISLDMSSNEVAYEPSASILTPEGLYDTIKVVSVTTGTEVSCTANFNSSTITASTSLAEENAEDPEMGEVCKTTDTSAQGTKVEKANMLSMAVLGLRVLLAKSIAFNTLMSIKLFLF